MNNLQILCLKTNIKSSKYDKHGREICYGVQVLIQYITQKLQKLPKQWKQQQALRAKKPEQSLGWVTRPHQVQVDRSTYVTKSLGHIFQQKKT